MTPGLVFKDPYILDFLNLTDTFSELDLEAAILREIEKFILELGNSFYVFGTAKTHGDRQYGRKKLGSGLAENDQ